MTYIKKGISYFLIIVLSVFMAINYIIFIFPNSFAPAGIDGICTMIQDIFDINMGYLSLIVNIPLLICAYTFLNKQFAFKTLLFVVSFSLAMILLKNSSLSSYSYHTQNGSSIVLAPVAAGVIRGIIYIFTIKLNASSGGIDIPAAILKKKFPHLNFMSITFAINMIIALCSYFVYGMKFDPVICSIVYAFISSTTGKQIQAGESETVKFEIITPLSKELYDRISDELHLPATIMEAHGAYSGEDKQMIICVAKKPVAAKLEAILRDFPGSVVFKSTVDNSNMVVDYNKAGV